MNKDKNLSSEPKRRMTKQKQVILEELKKIYFHPSAEELYKIVKKRIDNISLSTIYRNLEVLSQSGLVKPITFSNDEGRFDGHMHEHYHIKCMVCGKIDDMALMIPDKHSEFFTKSSPLYKLTAMKIEFYGICPDCQTLKNRLVKRRRKKVDHEK